MGQEFVFPRTLGEFREAVQARQRPSGAVEEARIEHHLKRFIGPRPESYLSFYRQGQMHLTWRQAGPAVWLKRLSWHWPAVLAPLAWLLYRKLNVSAALFGCIAFSTILLETWTALAVGLVINLAVAALAKETYIAHGVRLVREADERFPSPEQRLAWLESQGGVSTQAAAIGLAVTAAQWSLPFAKLTVQAMAMPL